MTAPQAQREEAELNRVTGLLFADMLAAAGAPGRIGQASDEGLQTISTHREESGSTGSAVC